MEPRRIRRRRSHRKKSTLFWMAALTLPFLFPHSTLGADVDVVFEGISILGSANQLKTNFLPGEEVRVTVRYRVLSRTGNPIYLRLRISGDGWHESPPRVPVSGLGSGIHMFVGLRAAPTAAPGKVSLLVDVVSAEDTVSLQGRRHAYLNVGCPDGLPTEWTAHLQVGASPRDMALTGDGRYLYVTSTEDRKVTVIDLETRAVLMEIEDPDMLGNPAGVAPAPDGIEMLVVDSALQAIHLIDQDHVLYDTIPLNPTGEFGVTSPGDLAVNPVRNEAYITDSRGPRIFILDLASREVRLASLFAPGLSAGVSPLQVMLDPGNQRFVYVLCGGFNEVIKVDVVTGNVLDFIQLRNLQDPSSLWPAWSMAVNQEEGEIYVVVNPGGFETTYPTIESRIFTLPKNWLGGPGRRDVMLGSSIWDLSVRQDNLVYGIDSFRGEILVIDLATGTEMVSCAIPVSTGGRYLRTDPAQNRLFVAGWLTGFADIVELTAPE